MQLSPPPLFKHGTPALLKLALCLLISLALMIADSQFKALEQIRSIANVLISPIQAVMQAPRNFLRASYDYLTTKGSLEVENENLNKRVAELTLLANQSELLLSENAQLRNLIGIAQQSRFKILISEILFSPPNPLSQRIIIDRGANDNISLGQGVADHQGIVGQVVRVMENRSEVALLDDRDMVIPIQVARNGLRGALYGNGRGRPLELRHMAAISDLQVGDILMTSGIDGIYPPGFAVATIDKIDRNVDKNFASVYCSPIGGVNRFRHVMILFYDANYGPRPTANTPSVNNAPNKPSRLYRGKP
ncbi:rod shape-determining protein MreC [Polynucleobacter sp. MWH-Loch1C5]|uniref:rod shape-determining protein MreC n=1 Tax=Polynucleobacter sp. MWH-Loch1C5 TaxID=2689108 RepID=UPI001C0C57EA|nr:rod shape-determining protein MreC [Polynucleobacter sp. MWH-Loch1C5]